MAEKPPGVCLTLFITVKDALAAQLGDRLVTQEDSNQLIAHVGRLEAFWLGLPEANATLTRPAPGDAPE